MANDLNMVALIGRLTRDADMKFTNGGMAILSFSLAVNKRKKVGEQWEDEAQFFDCTFFGKGAESIEAWMTQGKQVGIQGELKQNRWEQDGQSRSKVVIIASSVQLLSSPGDNKKDGSAPPKRATAPPPRPSAPRSTHNADTASASAQYGRKAQQAPQQELYGQQMFGPEQFDSDQIPF